MTERFNPPTRKQLAEMTGGDDRLVRAFEQLFKAAGVDISGLQDQIDDNESDITSNLTKIKTNGVLVWLTM